MTTKKDLKRRVRERQARTGESYVAARAQVVAAREPAISVEEMTTLDAPDFKCPVIASSRLLAVASADDVLARVRDALIATEGDAGTEVLRALALRGEPLPGTHPRTRAEWVRWWDGSRRFAARMRAGIGGVSDRGDMLALHVGATFVLVAAVPGRPVMYGVAPTGPRLILTLADGRGLDPAMPFAFPRLLRTPR